ncbi:MAG TPA: class I SAM-dependent methyltransferase [Tepidisphaeraceae bacterium]|nr:class I SAM-dependent methyltransferase [Tepidisphaeraceae bacterium]
MLKLPLLACALLSSLVGAAPVATAPSTRPAQAPAATTQASVYTYGPRTRDGIGKYYMGREIAHFMSHRGAGWLERPKRDAEENTTGLVNAIELRPTDVVADIGAGTGYYTFRLAPKVPQGKVLAVDIQQEMLDLLTAAAAKREVTNVEPILGTTSDPKLPEAGVDVVLMVDAYHEFDHPREMMEAIVRALKPGGRVVLVEFRAEDPAVRIKPLHKMSEVQAVKEMTAAGLKHVQTLGVLPKQHLMVFEKPLARGGNN